MSSIAPNTTKIAQPASNALICEPSLKTLLIKGNCDAKDKPASKPRTMARPPSLGIGLSCTSLSLTLAINPNRSAKYLAIGVVK